MRKPVTRYTVAQVIDNVGKEYGKNGECSAIDMANEHARDMRHPKELRDAAAAISSFLTRVLAAKRGVGT